MRRLIEPLSFCVIYPVGKKSYESINLFDLSEFDITCTIKFQTGLLRMLPGSLNKLNLLYIFPYILVHV